MLPSQLSRETVEALNSLSESAKAELNEKWASMQAATDEEKPAGSGSHEEKETVAAIEVSTPRQAEEKVAPSAAEASPSSASAAASTAHQQRVVPGDVNNVPESSDVYAMKRSVSLGAHYYCAGAGALLLAWRQAAETVAQPLSAANPHPS